MSYLSLSLTHTFSLSLSVSISVCLCLYLCLSVCLSFSLSHTHARAHPHTPPNVHPNCTQEPGWEQENQLRVALACMLISNGAYVDVPDFSGRSPLTYGVPAVKEGVDKFMKHK